MAYHAPSKCPVCGDKMEVTRLRCNTCATELTGRFDPCRFCMLEEKHMQFVLTFLRCRGSIKEVERALGVSYPTVRNMMDAALEALGLSEKEEKSPPDAGERAAIIDGLAKNEFTVDEALERLKGMKGDA